MRTLRKNQQPMKYSLQIGEMPIYNRDENREIIYEYYEDDEGNKIYYLDEDGNKIPSETGENKMMYSIPEEFSANINNKLDEVTWTEYGIDNSTNYSQIVVEKGTLPLKTGSIIWKKSEVKYKDKEETMIDETSADYIVKGVADEGLSVDLFLLQRNLK